MSLHLRARLLLSYVLVAVLLVVAFSSMGVGLSRTNEVVEGLKQDLTLFENEQRIYRAAWDIELVARRGIVGCERGTNAALGVVRALTLARTELEEALRAGGAHVEEMVRESAEGYGRYARELEEAASCEAVLSLPGRQLRLTLDENLTTVWSERVRELRLGLQARDERARQVGTNALRSGVVFGVLGIIAAGALAYAQSRSLSTAVAWLGTHARRIGRGDFTPLPPLRGPAELRELALELDRMQAQLAGLDQLKSAFVASVSHDLRTPLARVREALGLLADGSIGPLNERQARVVHLARSACEREIRLVTSVLDLSRVQSGQPLRRNTGASIDQIVQTVMTDLEAEAEERKVSLRYDRPPKPIVGPMDDPLIERALSNLVHNAISVSPAGKTVRIRSELVMRSLRPEAAPAPTAQVSVQDEGPGVPAAVREKLFQPFASHDTATRRRGTGLGLTIAREMIVAHGGELRIVDHEGPGALFAFWIPLETAAQPEAQ